MQTHHSFIPWLSRCLSSSHNSQCILLLKKNNNIKKKRYGQKQRQGPSWVEEYPTKSCRLFFILKIWVVSVQEPSFRGQGREHAYLSDAGWENWEGSPISWVIWQEGCWMSQHFRWQWKAWSSLVFGRLLWVSSLGVEPFAWDIKGAVLTLSPHLPWHHTPARHSCEGVPCALAQQGSPGMCMFGKCLLCCLTYTLNKTVWELGKQLLLLGSAA